MSDNKFITGHDLGYKRGVKAASLGMILMGFAAGVIVSCLIVWLI